MAVSSRACSTEHNKGNDDADDVVVGIEVVEVAIEEEVEVAEDWRLGLAGAGAVVEVLLGCGFGISRTLAVVITPDDDEEDEEDEGEEEDG